MKITGFQPLVVSPDAEALIALFNELGFEHNHTKGVNDEAKHNDNIVSEDLKDANGFRMGITGGGTNPQDIVSIRINVDDFDAALELFEKHGFKNMRPEPVRTSSSIDTFLVAPHGMGITLTQHLK